MRSSVSKEKFDLLTKQQGYKQSKKDEEEPEMALELVNMNMNEQIAEAVKIAIINADNRGSHVLGKEDIDAVKRILRIFPPPPPEGVELKQNAKVVVPPQVPPLVPTLDKKTKQRRIHNVAVKSVVVKSTIPQKK
jgi:hypothetical protein